uniref:CSON011759 protein n=1 Tax=Culicoides sonorensis TaxID=179676 RepID=A0A336M6H2_CULSO
MDVSVLSDEEKFYKILHLLLKFNVSLNDIYIEKFISELRKEETSKIIKVDVIINWINSIQTEYENGNKINRKTFCLAIHLTNLLCESEENFFRIEANQILEKFVLLIKKNDELQMSVVILAFTLLLRQLNNLRQSISSICNLKVWTLLFNFDNPHHTQLSLREQSGFIVDLLIILEERKQYSLCYTIIESMISPLVKKKWYDATKQHCTLNDPDIKVLMQTFHQYMEHFFLHIIKQKKKLVSSYYLLVKFSYQNKGWESRDVSIEATYVHQLLRSEIAADFVRLVFMRIPSEDNISKPLSFEKFTINFYNYIYFCTERLDPHNVLIVSEYVARLWAKLGHINMQPSEVISHSNLKFGDQILMIQLMPVLHVIKERNNEETEYLDKFCLKLFYISCEYTTRHLYAIQEVLRLSGKCVLDLACKSIKSLVQSQGLLTNDRAILVFQALIYCLSEFLPLSSASEVLVVLEKQHLLSSLLSGLYSLIKNYRITWKECIESSTLVNISLALLANPLLTARQAVQVLNLLQISIEHFLSPNMALLMDHLDGSGLENLGPSIYSRLSDDSWEVRDSTIQLVTSIIKISKAKYLTFQNMLLDNKILPVILEIATKDSEEYVRANAFNCLKYMLEVKSFWNPINASNTLLHDLVNVIFNEEEEALVKRQAVNALSSLYAHVGINSETAGLCFSTMAYICVNDLDWEVKVNGLEFWRIVLEQTFHAQGWTSDGFPHTLFTGKQKKIIHLTPCEIYNRLGTILSAYEYYGGFGVILSCINDKSDLLVAEKSLQIIEMLKSRLQKYSYIEKRLNDNQSTIFVNITLDDTTVYVSRKNSITNKKLIEFDNNINATHNVVQKDIDDIDYSFNSKTYERVIDEIVTENDLSLLSYALEKMQLKCNIDKNQIDEYLFSTFSKVSELEFLNIITKINLNYILGKRREWLLSSESFSTLLNDIIYSFTPNDSNDVDCF